ncbi:MAG TPA: chemotaxis response regulator protein-glutamate methylesterase [Burkholderiales bacterium]|nr:chemotaxis response regulator protein-glutamate methylesterase [Burkholderiales bacterium]
MNQNPTAARSPSGKIRAVIVDDSALVRKMLAQIINSQPDMEAVGAAPDPIAAREMIRALDPDVITLDVEMPKMDGLEFLEKLMRLRPTPVVMVSTLTEKGSETTLRALELGAVDFVAKPKIDLANGLMEYAREITDKIRVASSARLRRAVPTAAKAGLPALDDRGVSTEKLLVIGASTGGTEAIRELLADLPPDCPAILIAQHMPEGFTRSFAQRLDKQCRITVSEAAHDERMQPGHAYIAPGHSHLLLRRSGASFVTELSQADPVNRHRPSVEVLFSSAAKAAGPNAIGVILTGMGKDGALGLLEMRRAGAHTFAQDEESCVVFGMPKEAIAAGAVDEVVSLSEMSRKVMAQFALMRKSRVRA